MQATERANQTSDRSVFFPANVLFVYQQLLDQIAARCRTKILQGEAFDESCESVGER